MSGPARYASGRWRTRLCRVSLAMLVSAPALLAVHAQERAGAQFSARGELTDAEIPFHRVTYYRVTAEAPAVAEIALAPWAEALPGLTVTPGESEVTLLPGGRKQWVQALRLAPIGPFQYTLPPLTVLMDGVPAVELQPGVLNVRALTPEERAGVSAPEPLLTLADLVPPAQPWRWRVVMAAAALLIAAGCGLAWHRAGRPWPRTTQQPRDPLAEALEALAALEAGVARGELGCDAVYVLISTVLRDYLERGIGLHAHELSTPELVAGPLSALPIPSDLRGVITDLLVEADRVKFAQVERSPAGQQEAIRAARGTLIALDQPAPPADVRGAA